MVQMVLCMKNVPPPPPALMYVQSPSVYTHTRTRTHTPTHSRTRTNTRATASAHIPGAVRWRHELVMGPARREQVEGNVVRNSIIGRV